MRNRDSVEARSGFVRIRGGFAGAGLGALERGYRRYRRWRAGGDTFGGSHLLRPRSSDQSGMKPIPWAGLQNAVQDSEKVHSTNPVAPGPCFEA